MSIALPREQDAIPAVSVIIPTYNRATLLYDAINSVFAQSYTNFELIVVDDGSTDNTDAIIKAFKEERLIYVRQENKGRSAARNKALALARGRYIAFLDSDDLYLPDKLKRQVSYMDAHPKIGMLYTSAQCIDEHGEQLKGHVYLACAEGDIYKDIAFFRPLTITLPTVMVRREVFVNVGFFDDELHRFEDTDMWRRIAKKYMVGIISEPTCLLRTHQDNSLESQQPEIIMKHIDQYITKVFREDRDKGAFFLRTGASRLYEYYGKAFLSIPTWYTYGARLLMKALALAPFRIVMIPISGIRGLLGGLARRARVMNSQRSH